MNQSFAGESLLELATYYGTPLLEGDHVDIASLLSDCKAENLSLLLSEAKVALIFIFSALILLMLELAFSSDRSWISRVTRLWIAAKLRALSNGSRHPEPHNSNPLGTVAWFYSFLCGGLVLLLVTPWVNLLVVQISTQPKVVFDKLGIFAKCADMESAARVGIAAVICAIILAILRFTVVLFSSIGRDLNLLFKLWREATERRLRAKMDTASDG